MHAGLTCHGRRFDPRWDEFWWINSTGFSKIHSYVAMDAYHACVWASGGTTQFENDSSLSNLFSTVCTHTHRACARVLYECAVRGCVCTHFYVCVLHMDPYEIDSDFEFLSRTSSLYGVRFSHRFVMVNRYFRNFFGARSYSCDNRDIDLIFIEEIFLKALIHSPPSQVALFRSFNCYSDPKNIFRLANASS